MRIAEVCFVTARADPTWMIRPRFRRKHSPQRGKRAMDVSKVVHLGDAAKFSRLHLFDRREYRDHGIVDPDVNGPETLFKGRCGRLDSLIIAYISCICGRCSSQPFHFRRCRFERRQVTRDQADSGARFAEFMSNGSS